MKTTIQKLRQISDYCSKHENCENCIYKGDECKLGRIMDELTRCPKYWDVDLVEKLLDDCG